jgi:Predicted carboxypeptidase
MRTPAAALAALVCAWTWGALLSPRVAASPQYRVATTADGPDTVRPSDAANGDYGGYYTWPEMQEKISEWRSKYPGLVHLSRLGTTVEGREIPLLRLSDDREVNAGEPEVLLMAGIHPREQQPQVCLVRFIDELLAGYGQDARLTRLLKDRQVWVVPMLNVDGKVYDMRHGNGRDQGADWRKNRRQNPDGKSFGVDLNRNFPVRWGGYREVDPLWKTTTTNPGASIYEGTGPLSEPESRALTAFIESRPNLRAFLDIHSPLRCILFPPYLTRPEHERFMRLVGGMRDRQKDNPYRITKSEPDAEPRPGYRSGNTGLTYHWAYYVRGVYAVNFEIGLDERYPPVKDILAEYEKNVREPLLYFLEVGGELPAAKPGAARVTGWRVEGEPTPGARVSLTPTIEGECAYAVLVSEGTAAVVQSEYRNVPVTTGYTVEVPKEAKPGEQARMTLYLWDRDRGVSTATYTMTVGETKK